MKRICSECGAEFEGLSQDTRCPDCRRKWTRHTKERICTQCGNAYTTSAPRSSFCPDCAKKRRKDSVSRAVQRQNDGTARRLGSIDICQRCGAEYVVNGGAQRFCSSCRDSQNEFRAQRIAGRKFAYAKCVVCGKEFPIKGHRSDCCSAECTAINCKNLSKMCHRKTRALKRFQSPEKEAVRRAAMLDLLAQGCSPLEIGHRLNLSPARVRKTLITIGAIETEESKLYAQGKSIEEIAQILGRSIQRVRSCVPYVVPFVEEIGEENE